MEKITVPNRPFCFPIWKIIFSILPSATLQRNNEIPNQSNLLGLRKDRK